MKSGVRVPALTSEASLKRAIRRHLTALGFTRSSDGSLVIENREKEAIRSLHAAQRESRRVKEASFVHEWSPQLVHYFANGDELLPNRISPVLERIESGTWQSALFRYASMSWSVPVSNGYGRRLRYLVWDACNDKLMGIMAIGDPVFNLRVRDDLIGWSSEERKERLLNMMDAYVLGAVPPYNKILGGKLVACLVRTRDVYDDFAKIYGRTAGIISGRKKNPRLLAVTTSSSLGRSSVYNRLRLAGTQYFKSLGYTLGWGHFHIPDELFEQCRKLLRVADHSYANKNRFGDGPNWKLRTIRASLKLLGLNERILQHGIKREVFISELASNSLTILRGASKRPDLSSLLSIEEVGRLAVERWLAPRAQRNPDFQTWRREFILEAIQSPKKASGKINKLQIEPIR